MKRNILMCALGASLWLGSQTFAVGQAPFAREQAVSNLLSKMTVEEKVLQLQSSHPNAVLRLGVPQLQVCEALHGVIAPGATAFPGAIALGATWDTQLVEEVSTVIAHEARALGYHQAYAPMLGLAQDARWGRVEESFGEDPYLVTRLGVAYIFGMQGRGEQRFDQNHIVATAKHFAADGQPIGGQNGGSFDVSERTLRETHLMPFEAAVKEAHVGAIMPAHHALNGVPCHANSWLLNDLLRGEWGFDGFIVSDFRDIYNLANGPEGQHVVVDGAEAARLALATGVDAELAPGEWNAPKRTFAKTMLDEIQAGRVPMWQVERAAARNLRAKLELNLRANLTNATASTKTGAQLSQTDNADGAGDLWGKLVRDGQLDDTSDDRRSDAQKILNNPAHDALALKAAQRAIVLLKNDGGLLPLQKGKVKRIAVVGPLAQQMNLGGYSTPKPKFYVNVVDGIKAEFGEGVAVTFEPGCELTNDSTALLPKAVAVAREADVVVAVVGSTREQMGENLDRDNLDLVGGQEQLVKAVHATGKPVIVILLNGGPISIRWIKENVPAVIEGWQLGQATGMALAQLFSGAINPGGKLPVTIPENAGRSPSYYYRLPAARARNFFNSPGDNLFPFGHGLSYTMFKYDDLKISPAEVAIGEFATVSVKVTNTGSRAGDEVVQLYIHDDVSSLVRPAKELRGFQRITLAPGESRVVEFAVGFDELKFWKEQEWVVERGSFTLMVGSSSEDIRQQGVLLVGSPAALKHPLFRWADDSRLGRPLSKDPSVIRFGGRYLMYFSLPPFGTELAQTNAPKGWNIGIAESTNLVVWKKVGELRPAQDCDKNGLCAPGARVLNGKVHLFYQTYGNFPKDAICHAVSADGINFQRDESNPVFHPTGDWNNGRAIDAEVFPDGNRLLLYFATRDSTGKTQELGVASAPINSDFSRKMWTQLSDTSILKPELVWETRCIEAATVTKRGDTLVMFYAGGFNNDPQQIGVAVSKDGVNWMRQSELPLLANGVAGEWNSSESGHPGFFEDDNGRSYLFFQGNNDHGKTWLLACVELEWNGSTPKLKHQPDRK